MALSANELRLAKWLYWIILIAAHLYICYMLFTTQRPIAAIIWLILGAMLIYIMYPYYFPPGGAGSQWPPYITACPDYLTVLAPNLCVDYVGLNSPRLKKSDPEVPPPPTDSTRVFNASGTLSQKAANAQSYGLTWEGVV